MKGVRSQVSTVPAIENLADALDVRLDSVAAEPRMPRLRGTTSVTAVLPTGGAVWLDIRPPTVSSPELERLRRAVNRNQRRSAIRNRAIARRISRTSRKVGKDIARLAKARQLGDAKVRRKLAKGDGALTRRVDATLGRRSAAVGRRRKAELANVRRIRRRDLWDSIVLASAIPLFTAYGQKTNPFAEHNLTLLLSLGVWLLGDEISDLLSARRGDRSGFIRNIDIWSYVAPLGNVFTGWWLLHDRQHARFVTGLADDFVFAPRTSTLTPIDSITNIVSEVVVAFPTVQVAPAYQAVVDLVAETDPLIAPDHIDDFLGFSEVVAAASVVSVTWGDWVPEGAYTIGTVTAEVSDGTIVLAGGIDEVVVPAGQLVITVALDGPGSSQNPGAEPIVTDLRVAWMVDTQEAADE